MLRLYCESLTRTSVPVGACIMVDYESSLDLLSLHFCITFGLGANDIFLSQVTEFKMIRLLCDRFNCHIRKMLRNR